MGLKIGPGQHYGIPDRRPLAPTWLFFQVPERERRRVAYSGAGAATTGIQERSKSQRIGAVGAGDIFSN